MHVVISPAKTIDMTSEVPVSSYSDIKFPEEASELAGILKKKSREELKKLMGISDSLAKLNYDRFVNWHFPYDKHESRQAVFAFKGDVYAGLDAYKLTPDTIDYAQRNLLILSGLYGLLRPLDLILPYRLEMGTKLENREGDNLYRFWGDKITEAVNSEMEKYDSSVLINLASNEYFKSINLKKLKGNVITPVFKNSKNGEYKVISIYAKRARGLMTRFILNNRIKDPEELLGFSEEGYYYNPNLSSPEQPVFTREYQ
ncbi:MAG: peroxide stress protein YaaA [Chlorobi bacterium]|nr:peroxide stress protein YaaA [Chlorobiota bacterium]